MNSLYPTLKLSDDFSVIDSEFKSWCDNHSLPFQNEYGEYEYRGTTIWNKDASEKVVIQLRVNSPKNIVIGILRGKDRPNVVIRTDKENFYNCLELIYNGLKT